MPKIKYIRDGSRMYSNRGNWCTDLRMTFEKPSMFADPPSVYYPPEVRRGKYWGLGLFLLQYFPLSRYENYCIIFA